MNRLPLADQRCDDIVQMLQFLRRQINPCAAVTAIRFVRFLGLLGIVNLLSQRARANGLAAVAHIRRFAKGFACFLNEVRTGLVTFAALRTVTIAVVPVVCLIARCTYFPLDGTYLPSHARVKRP